MGIVARQSFYNSIYSYAGIGVAALNNVILVPWVFESHPLAEWGLLQYMTGLLFVLVPIAGFGFPGALVRFMPDYRNGGRLTLLQYAGIFTSITTAVIMLGFSTWYFLLHSGSRDISPFSLYMPLLLLMMLGSLLSETLGAYSRSMYRTGLAVMLKELSMRLLTALLLILYGLDVIHFGQFMIIFSSGYLMQGILQYFDLRRRGLFKEEIRIRSLDRKSVRDILVFSTFTALSGVSASLAGRLDILLIKEFFDLKAVALYAIPFYVGSLINAPSRSVGAISFTMISDYWKKNRIDKLKEIYQQTALNQFLAGGFLFLMIWLNLDILMAYLGDRFGPPEVKWIILFIGSGSILNVAFGANGQIIEAGPFYRWSLYLQGSLLLLTLMLQLILIPTYGIPGAAFGAALSLGLFNVLKSILIYVKIRIHPVRRNNLYAFLLFFITLTAVGLLPMPASLYTRGITRALLIIAFYFTGIIIFGISTDMRNMWHKILTALRRR